MLFTPRGTHRLAHDKRSSSGAEHPNAPLIPAGRSGRASASDAYHNRQEESPAKYPSEGIKGLDGGRKSHKGREPSNAQSAAQRYESPPRGSAAARGSVDRGSVERGGQEAAAGGGNGRRSKHAHEDSADMFEPVPHGSGSTAGRGSLPGQQERGRKERSQDMSDNMERNTLLERPAQRSSQLGAVAERRGSVERERSQKQQAPQKQGSRRSMERVQTMHADYSTGSLGNKRSSAAGARGSVGGGDERMNSPVRGRPQVRYSLACSKYSKPNVLASCAGWTYQVACTLVLKHCRVHAC